MVGLHLSPPLLAALAAAPATPQPANFTLVDTSASAWRCPVCGMAFNASVYSSKPHVLFRGGQTLAIGGEDCVEKLDKDPSAHLNASAVGPPNPSRAGEKLTCPVSGETFVAPADSDAHFVQFNHGQSIYTCCPGCAKRLLANLTQYVKELPLRATVAVA